MVHDFHMLSPSCLTRRTLVWCLMSTGIIILMYLMHTLRQHCTLQRASSESPRQGILCSTRLSGFNNNVEKFQNTPVKIFIFLVQTGSVCFKLQGSMHIQSLKHIRQLKGNNLLTLIIPLQLWLHCSVMDMLLKHKKNND